MILLEHIFHVLLLFIIIFIISYICYEFIVQYFPNFISTHFHSKIILIYYKVMRFNLDLITLVYEINQNIQFDCLKSIIYYILYL